MLPPPSMSDQVTEIMLSSDLQQQIIQQLSEQTNIVDWVISGPVIKARECVLYKATSVSHPHNIAIKVYRDQQPRKHNTLPQYEALERFAPLLNTVQSECRVPVGFGSFPQQRIFLMEWVQALSLEHRLWRNFYHKNRQQNGMRSTFAWLQKFHQHADPAVKPVNINHYLNRLQQVIQGFNDESLLAKNPVFLSGLECIDRLSDYFRGLEVTHARLHGDFTPSNVLIDEHVVTAIDITGKQLLPVAEDITLQLAYIAIGYPNMLTRMDMRHPPADWPLLEMVLDAYGYPADEQQRRFLLYVFLFQLLRRWLVIAQRNKQRRTPLLDRWRLRNSQMIVAGVVLALDKACEPDG